MTRALEKQLSRIETALNLADDGAGLGLPYELVPVMWSEEHKALFRRLYEGRADADLRIADLEKPYMALRIDAEGATTARGRRRRAEMDRLLAPVLASRRARLAELAAGEASLALGPPDHGGEAGA